MPISPSGKVCLGITIGDAAGIGPEVIVRSLSQWPFRRAADVLVLADPAPLNSMAEKLRLKTRFGPGGIPCFFEEKFPLKFKKGVSQKTLNDVYNVMDVHSSASGGEGFGISMVESQAAGIPNVQPNFTTPPELLTSETPIPSSTTK